MREILFRGKRIDNGEWVDGSLITDVFYRVGEGNKNSIPYILSVSGIDYDSWEDLDDDYGLYEVDHDTTGQYTGLTDKNGKKIFEGDIIKHYFSLRFSPSVGQVMYEDEHCKWVTKDVYNDTWEIHKGCIYEVIGNIHDNPELMEDKP